MTWFRIGSSVIAACIFTAGAAVLAPALAQVASPARGDEAAIREVVRKYVAAREARDPKAIEPLLTADADQLVSDGTWRRGRDDLVRGMLESSRKNGGRRDIHIESVRMLADDVALADGRYIQTGLAGGRNREMWTSIVLKRGPDGWRIAAIRNMLPAASAVKAKPAEVKPGPQTFRYEAEEGPPRDAEGEKRRDYAVLEAVLNDLTSARNPEYKVEIRDSGRHGEIVIDDQTCDYALDDPGGESLNSANQDPRHIPDDIRIDLLRRSAGPVRSLADFKPANRDILVRDLDGLFERAPGRLFADVEFRKQYPAAWGYVWAFPPGYSKDGQTALVRLDGGPGLGDHGIQWTYMLIRKVNRWEVLWRHLRILT